MSMLQLASSPTEEVVAKVNSLGLTLAAKSLGTSPATLCRWLKQQRFVRKAQYVKETQTQQTT